MAVQFRDMMNRVLRNVGETEVAAAATELSSVYHKLLANFVNTIKEEIESACPWRVLRTQVDFAVTSGTTSATAATTNERAQLVRVQDQESGQHVPLVFDITDPANPQPLMEITTSQMDYLILSSPSTYTAADITYFTVDSYTDGTIAPLSRLRVFPAPSSAKTIRTIMTVPQARLADSDLNTWIKIPASVLELGATWYALAERGEELGTNNMFTEERYRNALNSAVARDISEQGDLDLVPV